MNDPCISIIAGGARGIGFGIARALAARGDQVVVGDILFSEKKAAEQVKERIGQNAVTMELDVTRSDRVAEWFRRVIEQFGRIDVLVNAVGTVRPAPIQETSEADWDKVIDVNLKGAFLLSREAAVPMIRQKGGRIIHIGSTASHTSAAGLSVYSATKHGLIGLVKGMACDLAAYGITVNAVCPGNTDTEVLEKVFEHRAAAQHRTVEEVRGEVIAKTPAGRLGKPSDVAAMVLFLTSPEAEYVTGQALTVDGGRSLNLV